MTAEQSQRAYYARTAAAYDAWHPSDEPANMVALGWVSALIRGLQLQSVLDVGSGTGRALRGLLADNPSLHIRGLEPVPELIEKAVQAGIANGVIVCGAGEHIPFPDKSFDAVCEFATLHHVPEPSVIISEMLRVARRAVFLSDANRFGQGNAFKRIVKLTAFSAGLGSWYRAAQTRGRGYLESELDGTFYSYSVYDSYAALASWSDRVVAVPTGSLGPLGRFGPILSSPHVLLCALKA